MAESLKVIFPDKTQYEFELGKPIVILGANGAGKTRFTVQLEKINDYYFDDYLNYGRRTINVQIHRLSAQKSLSINDIIRLIDLKSAENKLKCGYENLTNKRDSRYNGKPAINLLNDYNEVLSLLFAKQNKELEDEHYIYKEAYLNNQDIPKPITTIVETVTNIWNELLPQRKLDLSGNNVHAIYNDKSYHGQEMSDGERVILYMICQALVLEPKTLFIIDEPELHIHKAILNKLWTRLEQERQAV